MNSRPHARMSAPGPYRSTQPTTSSETAQPTASRMASTGSTPQPMSVIANENATQHVSATIPTPITSLTIPNSATPAMYSSSVSGVVIRFSMLRDHDSSRNPTDTE